MLARRNRVDELPHIHRGTSVATSLELVAERIDVNAFVEAEVDVRARRAIENVIRLILREALAELAPNVLGSRMTLHRKIPAVERVEKVEPDWKLRAEAFCRATEHRLAFLKHERVERGFEQPPVALEHDSI